MTTLGERFAKLHAKPAFEVKRAANIAKANAQQKGKRNDKIQAIRGLKPNKQQISKVIGKKQNTPRPGKPVM